MHNFPIKLDLSNFFTDARRCSLVLIDATWENIKNLQDHIQKLFQLKDLSLLTDDGCYLPPKESIKVLNETQTLKAFKLNLGNSFEDETQDCSKTLDVVEKSKKRKKRADDTDVEFTSSTPNKPKRTKSKNINITNVHSEEVTSFASKNVTAIRSKDASTIGSRDVTIGSKDGLKDATIGLEDATTSKDATTFASRNKSKNETIFVSKDTSTNMTTDASTSVSKDTTTSMSKGASRKALADATTFSYKDTTSLEESTVKSTNVSKDTTTNMSEDTTTNMSKDTTTSMSKGASRKAISDATTIAYKDTTTLEESTVKSKRQIAAVEQEPETEVEIVCSTESELMDNSCTTTANQSQQLETTQANQSQQLETTQANAGNRSKFRTRSTFKNTAIIQGDEASSENAVIIPDDEAETLTAEQSAAEISCHYTKGAPEAEFQCPLMELDTNSVRLFKLPRHKVERVKILENILIQGPPKQSTKKTTQTNYKVFTAETMVNEQVFDIELELQQLGPEEISAERDITMPEENNVTDSPVLTTILEESSLDLDSEDDIMVLDDTNVDDSDSDVQQVPDNKDDIISDMLQTVAPLTNLPNVGDTILCKLHKVRGSKSSTLTDYIAGTCGYVNRRTKSITLAVIACADVDKIKLRQYACNLDDSSESSIILTINLREMIEPKVVVSTLD